MQFKPIITGFQIHASFCNLDFCILFNLMQCLCVHLKNDIPGWAWYCNSSTLGGHGGQITRDQEFKKKPGHHGEIPSLLKIPKVSWCGGACL